MKKAIFFILILLYAIKLFSYECRVSKDTNLYGNAYPFKVSDRIGIIKENSIVYFDSISLATYDTDGEESYLNADYSYYLYVTTESGKKREKESKLGTLLQKLGIQDIHVGRICIWRCSNAKKITSKMLSMIAASLFHLNGKAILVQNGGNLDVIQLTVSLIKIKKQRENKQMKKKISHAILFSLFLVSCFAYDEIQWKTTKDLYNVPALSSGGDIGLKKISSKTPCSEPQINRAFFTMAMMPVLEMISMFLPSSKMLKFAFHWIPWLM